MIWRRPFLPCVKSSSLNFYFYTVWAEMTLFFRSKHWKQNACKSPYKTLLCRKISSWKSRLRQKKLPFSLRVCSCKQHLFIAPRADHMELRCTCPDIGKNKICNFCFEIKYLLNFRAFKICMSKVPESFQEHLIQLPDYLDSIFLCKPLFKCFPRGRIVNIYLDNPKELCMVRVKNVD